MYRGCTVGVVVPAYNEEGFVGEVVDTLPEFVDRAYVVDDASTDGTWAEIREHAAAANRAAGAGRGCEPGPSATGDGGPSATGGEGGPGGAGETGSPTTRGEKGAPTTGDSGPSAAGGEAASAATGNATRPGGPEDGDDRRVVPIRHEENRGVGGAIATGYRRALADGMDVTAVVNGDGQMDPAILDRILDPVATGRAGYAKGDRLTGADRRAAMSRWRLFGNALLTGLTRVATGYWRVTDPQNGYTAISREALAAVDLEDRYEGYGFCNDLLAALGRADVRVADVPMTAVYGDERSGIRYSRFVPGLSALLLVAFLRRLWTSYVVRELHPLVALYALGVAGLAAGAAGVVGAGLAGAAGATVPAVATGLAAVQTGLLGAGLLALGATVDRAAADDRVLRVAAEGTEADAGDDPAGDGGERAPRAEVRADGGAGERGCASARTGDGAEARDDADARDVADADRSPGTATRRGPAGDGSGEVTGR